MRGFLSFFTNGFDDEFKDEIIIRPLFENKHSLVRWLLLAVGSL